MVIKPPHRISLLSLAHSPEFDASPHRHYMAYPVKPGPQACLVELHLPNGGVFLTDTLTVLPNEIPNAVGFRDPITALSPGCFGPARAW